MSKIKEDVKQLAIQGQLIETANDIVKDTYILRFKEFKTTLIDKLEHFIV